MVFLFVTNAAVVVLVNRCHNQLLKNKKWPLVVIAPLFRILATRLNNHSKDKSCCYDSVREENGFSSVSRSRPGAAMLLTA